MESENLLRRTTPVVRGSYSTNFDTELEAAPSCAINSIFDNISKNAFLLIGKTTNLASTFNAFPAESIDELYMQTLEFGQDLASFVRIGLSFVQ